MSKVHVLHLYYDFFAMLDRRFKNPGADFSSGLERNTFWLLVMKINDCGGNMEKNMHLWEEYYQKILANPHRIQTEIAEALNSSGNFKAIDCGCGTGADISFLVEKGYEVSGFDMHQESVKICSDRFHGNPNVDISQSHFIDFNYFDCGLVLANLSLFFCEPKDFSEVWSKIDDAILPGGVFCGDFMGFRDSWVTDCDTTVCPLTEEQVNGLFSGYKVEQFKENDSQGVTALGVTKHWHIYQVIAKKAQ
ncbi:methyltransferase domain-containing protein [Endozoicomonas sp. Mp262]|uniref:class I SAM-dependent methyltransferase n=1 Tax=Endozoicomonas sp. Mp262 TaxID=2919499 RepID=UPI0021D99636